MSFFNETDYNHEIDDQKLREFIEQFIIEEEEKMLNKGFINCESDTELIDYIENEVKKSLMEYLGNKIIYE